MVDYTKVIETYCHTETVYYRDGEQVARVNNHDTWFEDETSHLHLEDWEAEDY